MTKFRVLDQIEDRTLTTIVDNVFSNCKVAVNLADTSNNIINSNKITSRQVEIVLSDTTNKIFHNKIENSTNGIVLLNSSTPNPADSDNGKKIEQVNSTAFLNNMTVVN